MIRRYFPLLSTIILATCMFASALSVRADEVRIWEADTGLGGITDRAKINSYLDDLKAHSVNGLWLQVELYSDGTVNYKKTTFSKLPTAKKFSTGTWADDDFLGYVISQAKSRGMKVMIKFHGSNHAAWDKHTDWRKLDSKGKEVLWSGTLKNFCVNSPYWDAMFFPMVKEIAQNYDVDGFYLDTCQVAYEVDDSCFCAKCKSRFEKETGKKLPLKPVDRKFWTDPVVKQHAVKRVEWMNGFYEKYSQVIRDAKPSAEVLLNVSGGYNSYKDTVSTRHAAKYVTTVTPEPVNTPRMYAVTTNRALVKAKQPKKGEDVLASEEIVPAMDRYGYLQYTTKLMQADGDRKPVVPFSRFWFTDDESGMASTDVAIKEIESAIGAGAKGWCFFGYLAHAQETGGAKKSAWSDPKFVNYLKDLATGPRSKWIADMVPDTRIAILVDRDAEFWTGEYWKRFQQVGRLYSFLQYQRKFATSLISTSEHPGAGFGQSGYKLTKDILSRYQLVICPGLEHASVEDLQTLRDYYDSGGKLIVMGPVGNRGKSLGGATVDDAYRILRVATDIPGEPSGFVRPVDSKSPVFSPLVPYLGGRQEFRYSKDKNASLSYKAKFDASVWEIWANEITDSGKRPAILYTKESFFNPSNGAMAYVNTDMAGGFTGDMLMVLMNMVVVVPSRTDSVFPSHFAETTSVNSFRSADGMSSYFHIFTPEGETDEYIRLRANPNTYPISAEMIVNGGNPIPLTITRADREPNSGEMVVTVRGGGVLKPGPLPSGWAMIKIVYEHRDYSNLATK